MALNYTIEELNSINVPISETESAKCDTIVQLFTDLITQRHT
jgi:hypothetical protein